MYAKNVGPEWPWFNMDGLFYGEGVTLLREEEKEVGTVELMLADGADERRCVR